MWTMGPKENHSAILFLFDESKIKIPDMGSLKGDLWVPNNKQRSQLWRACGYNIYKRNCPFQVLCT